MKANNGKLWGTMQNGDIEIRSVTRGDLEEALDVLDKSFFLNEAICNATEINLAENAQARNELRELCRLTAEDGVSLVARHLPSAKIVAVTFNKIQYVPENNEEPFFLKFRKESTHSSQAQSLMDFMIDVDGETDVFEMFHIDCTCELMFLATLPEWERQGIGRTLTRYTIEIIKDLSKGVGVDALSSELQTKRPQAVTAIFTSVFSQKIGRSQGFKILNSVPYTRFTFNGKTYDQRINPMHKKCDHVAIVFERK